MANHAISDCGVLLSRVERARRHWRAVLLGEGAASLVASAVLLGFLCLISDNALHLSEPARLGVLIVSSAALLGLLVSFLVRPVVRRLSHERVAVHLERNLPELDSRLINSVILGKNPRKADDPFTRALVRRTTEELEGFRFTKAITKRRLAKCCALVALVGLIFAAYAVLFPDYLRNALARYQFNGKAPAPITHTVIDQVAPGNIAILSGEDVRIQATVSGRMPDVVTLDYGTRKGLDTRPMEPGQRGRYEILLKHVTRETTYRVDAGDAKGEPFTISIVQRPRIRQINLTYAYPDYTAFEPERIENSDGEIRVLEGSTATIEVLASKPIRKAFLVRGRRGPMPMAVSGKDKDHLTVALKIEQDDTYTFDIEDFCDIKNGDKITHTILALPDRKPSVTIADPAANLEMTATDAFPVTIKANDDYGVRRLELHLRKKTAKSQDWPVNEHKGWAYPPEDKPVNVSETFALSLADLKPKIGNVFEYRAVALDGLANEAQSETYQVRIITPAKMAKALDRARESFAEKLQQIIVLQRESNLALEEALEAATAADLPKEVAQLLEVQLTIRSRTEGLSQGLIGKLVAMRDPLAKLAAGLMLDAIVGLNGVAKEAKISGKGRKLAEVSLIQEEIITELERLAGLQQELLLADEAKRADMPKTADPLEDEDERVQEAQEALDGFTKKLTAFYKGQKSNLLQSQELAKMDAKGAPSDPETEEKKQKAWDKVKKKQQDLADLAKEAKDMTEALMEKDITNETLLKKMEDVHRAVADAVKAMERKETLRTLTKEEMALLMAGSVPPNGEAFLTAGLGNKVKWEFEDWPEEERPKLIVAPIPADLHDTLGELLDKEEELTDESDDMVSQMQVNVTDNTGLIGGDSGPCSNFAAKGRSGNTRPKSNEVGGRAGSGRTGKSSGEMVEDTDTGKEGSSPEERYTKEQMQKGFAKGKGEDRVGGSTSLGGKRSDSTSEFGLRGEAPVEWSEKRKLLGNRQRDLRELAELFHNQLRAVLGRADYDMLATILLMKEVEEDLYGGQYDNLMRKQVQVIRSLRTVGQRYGMHRDLRIDSAARQKPGQLESKVLDAMGEKYPAEYRKLLEDYYRLLSEAPVK